MISGKLSQMHGVSYNLTTNREKSVDADLTDKVEISEEVDETKEIIEAADDDRLYF